MKLYKTTIVIWSDEDPTDMELEDIAREATNGSCYCSKMTSDHVEDAESDADWDGNEFFDNEE